MCDLQHAMQRGQDVVDPPVRVIALAVQTPISGRGTRRTSTPCDLVQGMLDTRSPVPAITLEHFERAPVLARRHRLLLRRTFRSRIGTTHVASVPHRTGR
jgi:hypothetical protein